jgi:UDP-N-acetyl-D-mannosaminuronic acid dehydrogenase
MKKFENFIINKKDSFTKVLAVLDRGEWHEKGLGVVIEQNKVIGTITDGDVRRCLLNEPRDTAEIFAEDIMNPKPIVFKEKELEIILDDFANKLENRRGKLKWVTIVDENGNLNNILNIETVTNTNPKISVIGLGYVGLTLALVLSDKNFKVQGVEANETVLNDLKRNRTHIREPKIEKFLETQVGKNLELTNTLDPKNDVYIVTVGTPVRRTENDFELNKSYLEIVIKDLCKVLKRGDLIIFRSTVSIGSCREAMRKIEEKTGFKCGFDFYLSFAPERTEEGNALKELTELPQLIGGFDKVSTLKTANIFRKVTNTIITLNSLEETEMSKLLNNTFRDYVFGFSNYVSRLAATKGIDITNVINAANKDYPRNPIPLPSPGVGGPCLTKDPFIMSESFSNALDPIFVKSRMENENMITYVISQILQGLERLSINPKTSKILILGLAFKGNPKTGDLRNSTSIEIHDKLKPLVGNLYGFDFEADESECIDLGVDFLKDFESHLDKMDAILILNNHIKFKELDFLKINLTKPVILFDPWSLFQVHQFNDQTHINYFSISKAYYK